MPMSSNSIFTKDKMLQCESVMELECDLTLDHIPSSTIYSQYHKKH